MKFHIVETQYFVSKKMKYPTVETQVFASTIRKATI